MAIVTVDFDGTLYQGNSFNAMFQLGKKTFTIKEWAVVAKGVAKSIIVGVFKGKNALKHEFFKAFAKTFKGNTQAELEQFFQELVKIGQADIHYTLVEKIREHKNNGDTVIILSGALYPFLQAFTKKLQLDVPIISTPLLFDQNGRCTGDIGDIINGQKKIKSVQAWMKAQQPHNQKGSQEIWAYADSESDVPLLQFVDHPIVVNPNEDMKLIAEENKWQIFA